MQILVAYVAAMLAMFAIDALWLGVLAVDFYKTHIGHLMAPEFRFGAAGLFYLFYVAGIVYFAVMPALKERSSRRSILNGALFGFMAYMTYDLTNLATLRDWPVVVVVSDIVWGSFLSATAAWAGYKAGSRAGR